MKRVTNFYTSAQLLRLAQMSPPRISQFSEAELGTLPEAAPRQNMCCRNDVPDDMLVVRYVCFCDSRLQGVAHAPDGQHPGLQPHVGIAQGLCTYDVWQL